MAEEVGHGGGAGEQGGVRGKLLHRKALAGAAGAKLHQVVVALAEGDQPQQEEGLESLAELRGLVAHRTDQQVDPLLGAELGSELAVFLQVEARQLDRRELADREGRLAVARIPLHLHLGPHPAGEQPLEGMHIVIGDAQGVAAEVDALGHIGVPD